jgi:5,10-methylenetetrahydromethanopterin reductase
MSDGRFDFAFMPTMPLTDAVGLAELGERLGFRCMWVPDQGFQRDPFCIQALAAQRTSSLGLGIGITSPFTRLPMQIARAVATLDEAAGGRVRLGLGTGNTAHVLTPLGLPTDRPVDRMRDGMTIVRALLRGETVTFDGPHDRLTAVALECDPRPEIPLYVGTRGPRMLELAGELADGVLVESLFNGDGLPYVVERLRSGADGRRPEGSIDLVSWQLVVVTDDPAPVIQAHKPWIARALQVGPPRAMARVGVNPEVTSRVAAAMNRGDREAATAAVTDEAVRCLMLVGRPADLIARIERIFALGATSISLVGIGGPEQIASNLQAVSRDVMPAFDTKGSR